MAELKTQQNEASVEAFLNTIEDKTKRKDSFKILEMMRQATRAEPKMWGSSIIGFGNSHYKYESGREGDWFQIGFSPRKQNLTLYLLQGYDQEAELLKKLGKHKMGKSCLYIKKLTDVDLPTLQKIMDLSADRAGAAPADKDG